MNCDMGELKRKYDRMEMIRDRVLNGEDVEIDTMGDLMRLLLIEDEQKISETAIAILQEVLDYGTNKGKFGWSFIDTQEHIHHALEHLNDYRKCVVGGTLVNGETARTHLRHAYCRLMMACIVEVIEESEQSKGKDREKIMPKKVYKVACEKNGSNENEQSLKGDRKS